LREALELATGKKAQAQDQGGLKDVLTKVAPTAAKPHEHSTAQHPANPRPAEIPEKMLRDMLAVEEPPNEK
jgi:hypothetical protein